MSELSYEFFSRLVDAIENIADSLRKNETFTQIEVCKTAKEVNEFLLVSKHEIVDIKKDNDSFIIIYKVIKV